MGWTCAIHHALNIHALVQYFTQALLVIGLKLCPSEGFSNVSKDLSCTVGRPPAVRALIKTIIQSKLKNLRTTQWSEYIPPPTDRLGLESARIQCGFPLRCRGIHVQEKFQGNPAKRWHWPEPSCLRWPYWLIKLQYNWLFHDCRMKAAPVFALHAFHNEFFWSRLIIQSKSVVAEWWSKASNGIKWSFPRRLATQIFIAIYAAIQALLLNVFAR